MRNSSLVFVSQNLEGNSNESNHAFNQLIDASYWVLRNISERFSEKSAELIYTIRKIIRQTYIIATHFSCIESGDWNAGTGILKFVTMIAVLDK